LRISAAQGGGVQGAILEPTGVSPGACAKPLEKTGHGQQHVMLGIWTGHRHRVLPRPVQVTGMLPRLMRVTMHTMPVEQRQGQTARL
jgi:hypothetical protein